MYSITNSEILNKEVDKRLKIAANKICHNIVISCEIVNDQIRKQSVLKSKKKKKKHIINVQQLIYHLFENLLV